MTRRKKRRRQVAATKTKGASLYEEPKRVPVDAKTKAPLGKLEDDDDWSSASVGGTRMSEW